MNGAADSIPAPLVDASPTTPTIVAPRFLVLTQDAQSASECRALWPVFAREADFTTTCRAAAVVSVKLVPSNIRMPVAENTTGARCSRR